MPKSLKLYVAVVVVIGALALVAATFLFPPKPGIAIDLPGSSGSPTTPEYALGVLYWIALTLIGSAFPVQLPRGTQQAVGIAPIMGSLFLGGPAVAGWVAAIGTTELRELRGRVPWYGTLANHAALVLPAIVAGSVREGLLVLGGGVAWDFVSGMIVGFCVYRREPRAGLVWHLAFGPDSHRGPSSLGTSAELQAASLPLRLSPG